MKSKSSLFMVLWLILAGQTWAVAASVTTDKDDYSPGETALITGTGFAPGEQVELVVSNLTKPDDVGPEFPEHQPWQVTADLSGAIEAEWYVSIHEAGTTLLLAARGLSSGFTAQHTFTDASVVSIGVSSQSGTLTYGTVGTVTYSISFTNSSPGNSSYSGLSVSGLPSGVTYALNGTTGNGSPPPSRTLTITNGASTAAGTYTFTVSTTSPALSRTGTLVIGKAGTAISVSSSLNPSGYGAGVSFTAGLPAAATGNVIFLTNSTPFSTNALSSGSATSASIASLPRGTNVITASYAGDGNYLGSTNNLSGGQIVTNHPPVAGTINFTNSVKSFKMTLASLVASATDSDGDTLTLTGFSASTNGVTIVTNSTLLSYFNPNYVSDRFNYYVKDNFGGTATGTVNVVFYPFAAGQSGTVTPVAGKAQLKYFGIPNYKYSVQRSTNFVNWVTILTTNAPSIGKFTYEDDFSDLGGSPSSAYYRLVWTP